VNFICFDLEGPLSPQDNAYELMKLIPNGDRIFEVISRYDDLLTLKKKKDYEPGDTLALIVPFLLHTKISQKDMALIANKATLVDGAKEFIAELKHKDWWVGDITTCYQHYGGPITEKVGIPPRNVACTRFPSLDYFREIIKEDDLSIVEQVEKEIVALESKRDDEKILERLDVFFNTELSGNVLGAVMKSVRPLGGLRKVRELRRFAKRDGFKLNQVVVVGDSITDSRMLETVNKEGGIAVAFNANEYALKCANVGLASTNLGDLRLVTGAWEKGGKQEVEKVVKEKEKEGGLGNRNHFHWLANRRKFEEPLAIHKRIRNLVREEAAKLG